MIEETTAVERLAKDLEKKFEVTHAAGSTVMEISFTWSEPEVAQEVVKAWIEIYMEERTQALGRRACTPFYEAQTADSAAQIKSYKARDPQAPQRDRRIQHRGPPAGPVRADQRAARQAFQLDPPDRLLRQRHRIHPPATQGAAQEIVTVRQIALNPAQQDLRRLLNQKRLERADMMRTYTDDAPPVKAPDASIRATEKGSPGRRRHRAEFRGPRAEHPDHSPGTGPAGRDQQQRGPAHPARGQEKQLAELEAQRRGALDIEPTGALQRELNATERNYALYVDSPEKSRIDRELDKSQISNISVIEEATYNPGRIFPKTLLMLFLAVPFGLAVGLLVVYLCYLLDQRIHDGGLVEEKFGLPLWTTLPELSNSTARAATPSPPASTGCTGCCPTRASRRA